MTTLHGEPAKSSSSGRRQMLTTTNFLVLRYSEATTAAETAEKTECFKRIIIQQSYKRVKERMGWNAT